MGTNKTVSKKAPFKLIKVKKSVHQRIKVKAALVDKNMGDYVDEQTRD